jgi:hypothetical protein
MRPTQLAHKNRLASAAGGRIEQPIVLDGFQSMAGFELIMYGRFSGDHWGDKAQSAVELSTDGAWVNARVWVPKEWLDDNRPTGS